MGLSLTRKKGETIVIDGRITITVAAIRSNKVVISIDAPPENKILRGEMDPTGPLRPPLAAEAALA